jgi:hypothetical protein
MAQVNSFRTFNQVRKEEEMMEKRKRRKVLVTKKIWNRKQTAGLYLTKQFAQPALLTRRTIAALKPQ